MSGKDIKDLAQTATLSNLSAFETDNGTDSNHILRDDLATELFALKTTANLTEGANLYYTQARFDAAFGGKTTNDLTENTNLYFTDSRALTAVGKTNNATGFSVAGGTSSKTLTVADDCSVNQSLQTTDSPTFANVTVSTNLTLSAIPSATKASMLYYDTTTKLVSYGAQPAGSGDVHGPASSILGALAIASDTDGKHITFATNSTYDDATNTLKLADASTSNANLGLQADAANGRATIDAYRDNAGSPVPAPIFLGYNGGSGGAGGRSNTVLWVDPDTLSNVLGKMFNGSVSFAIDETLHNFQVVVRYSNGTGRYANISLSAIP